MKVLKMLPANYLILNYIHTMPCKINVPPTPYNKFNINVLMKNWPDLKLSFFIIVNIDEYYCVAFIPKTREVKLHVKCTSTHNNIQLKLEGSLIFF